MARWFGRSLVIFVLAIAAGVAGCGETGGKMRQPDAGIGSPTGSGSPCTLDTSKLDNCTL